MSKKQQETIKVFALGGLGEVSKNMYVVEVNREIVVIDAGLMFPEDDMLGVDIVIPDITYLLENKDRVLGIFLTHGHEDHIGALPYVLKQLNVPVYGTKLTLGLLEYKLKEANLFQSVQLRLIDPEKEIHVGHLTLSFFRTNHSIPDSIGVCVHTLYGMIVNTGDFKFDYTSVDNKGSEIQKMSEIGRRGVLCLMSDSANAERPGLAGSEKIVGQEISDIFYSAEGRIIVASAASNIHRLQLVFDAAERNRRRVVVAGREIENVVGIAKGLGYLNIRKGIEAKVDQMDQFDDCQLVLLTSGAQGEPMSGLAEMVNQSDNRQKSLKIKAEDTVFLADEPAIGTEKTISRIIDKLVRIGANVIYGKNSIYISDHGAQEELKLMIQTMTPKYFIPIHGEYRMLKVHGDLAKAVGIPDKHIFVLEKGDIVEFVNGEAGLGDKILSGNVLVDGIGVGDVGNIVLRDRKLLSEDGVLLVVVTLAKKTKEVLSGPEVISRGFVYVRESEELLEEAERIVSGVLERTLSQKISEWSSLKTAIRDALSRYLFDKTRRRPMILPIIMEV